MPKVEYIPNKVNDCNYCSQVRPGERQISCNHPESGNPPRLIWDWDEEGANRPPSYPDWCPLFEAGEGDILKMKDNELAIIFGENGISSKMTIKIDAGEEVHHNLFIGFSIVDMIAQKNRDLISLILRNPSKRFVAIDPSEE